VHEVRKGLAELREDVGWWPRCEQVVEKLIGDAADERPSLLGPSLRKPSLDGLAPTCVGWRIRGDQR
jgi:hypothetical protein